MILAILAESALRSVLLGSAVWIGLNLVRVRNPHVHMTSWVLVLLASLAMPWLMHCATVTIALDPAQLPLPDPRWSTQAPLPESLQPLLPLESAPLLVPSSVPRPAFDWWAMATTIYGTVAMLLLLRLLLGICLTWRLVRTATPVVAPWAADSDIRVSARIGGPVTFGTTILLPPQYADWDIATRNAVLAHERAHVANRDCYILLLAALNRAIFWFSPFAWWQSIRLAELAELISDARALEVVADRLCYAEILLELVQSVRQAPAGLDMARACTVKSRVERILDQTAMPARGGRQARLWTAAAIVPVVVLCAITIAHSARPALIDRTAESAATARQPGVIDFYAVGSTSVFAVFHQGDGLFGQLTGQRRFPLAAAPDGSYAYPALTGQISLALPDKQRPADLLLRQNGRDMRAPWIAELSRDGGEFDNGALESYVGWYQETPTRVLTVTRDGERLLLQETGQEKFAVAAVGPDRFASDAGDVVIFLRDAEAHDVTRVLRHEPIYGARLGPRITAAAAEAAAREFARRIAEVPDRFTGQSPVPGSRDAILRGLADMQRGTPNLDQMSPALAAKINRDAAELRPMFKLLGAVDTIYFRGVGPGGYDIYGVKFANGFAELRLLLGPDGKAEDVIFRPDGNDAPGGVAACSDEASLRAHNDTAPISVLYHNATGADIRLYRLDAGGKRTAFGSIGDDMMSSVWTNVDSPWVVADGSGKCLEIVLPGQRTRLHIVRAARNGGEPDRDVVRRSAPRAGTEEMLRDYIAALSRGAPNYDRMTPEVAAQTRQQLALNQAILSRLGELRALSFRGVSYMDHDVYMAHFANGTAEWRIALAKNGSIGRILLGPQY